MNIFALDKDPKKAAEYHNNRHTVKMILESVQLLVTPYYTLNGIHSRKDAKQFRGQLTLMYPSFPRDRFYGFGYYSHPCARWVQHSEANFRWLIDLAYALCEEYTLRYGKVHACQEVVEWFDDNPPNGHGVPTLVWKSNPLTVPANATTIKDSYTEFPDWETAVETYRQYYRTDKRHLAEWKTEIPSWFFEKYK